MPWLNSSPAWKMLTHSDASLDGIWHFMVRGEQMLRQFSFPRGKMGGVGYRPDSSQAGEVTHNAFHLWLIMQFIYMCVFLCVGRQREMGEVTFLSDSVLQKQNSTKNTNVIRLTKTASSPLFPEHPKNCYICLCKCVCKSTVHVHCCFFNQGRYTVATCGAK